jgi:hypothetical protein
MNSGAKEAEDALEKELAETKDQVKILKERTTETSKVSNSFIAVVYFDLSPVFPRNNRSLPIDNAGLGKELANLKEAA